MLPSSHPQVISQNQQAFIELLNEQPGEEGQGGQGAAGQGPPPPGAAGAGGPYGMPMTIQVTQDEKAAIDRVSVQTFGLVSSYNIMHDIV